MYVGLGGLMLMALKAVTLLSILDIFSNFLGEKNEKTNTFPIILTLPRKNDNAETFIFLVFHLVNEIYILLLMACALFAVLS